MGQRKEEHLDLACGCRVTLLNGRLLAYTSRQCQAARDMFKTLRTAATDAQAETANQRLVRHVAS